MLGVMFGNKAWTKGKEKCSKGQTGSGPIGWRIAKISSNNKSAKPCTKRIAKIEKPDIDGRGQIGATRRYRPIHDQPLDGGDAGKAEGCHKKTEKTSAIWLEIVK